MPTRTIIIILLAIAILLLGMLGFAYLANERNKPPQETSLSSEGNDTSDIKASPNSSIESIEQDVDTMTLDDDEVDKSTLEAEADIQAIN